MRGWFPGGRVPSLVVSTEVVSLFSLMTLLLACAAFLEPVGPTDEALIQGQLPTYPVATCVISDELLEEGEIVDVVVEGRLVRVCCSGCARRVKAAPARAIAKIDRAVIDQQVAAYPLKTCLKNIQEPLSGSAVNAVVGTRLVRTCCLDCAQQVKAEPAAFMHTLDAAYTAQQLPDYAVETCVVSDEPPRRRCAQCAVREYAREALLQRLSPNVHEGTGIVHEKDRRFREVEAQT